MINADAASHSGFGAEINAQPGSILHAYGQQDVTFTRCPARPRPAAVMIHNARKRP